MNAHRNASPSRWTQTRTVRSTAFSCGAAASAFPSARTAVLAAVLAACAGSDVLAQESIDRRLAVDPDGVVHVENISGSVSVRGWDRAEVHVTGTLGKGSEGLHFTTSGGRTRIEVELPEGRNVRVGGTDLTIQVPSRSRLEVETVSADVDVEGAGQEVEVSSVSGRIRVSGSAERFELATVSGNVDVDGASATREGALASVSGSLTFRGGLASGASLEAETVSGTIELTLPRSVSASFDVSTFSGGVANDLTADRPSKASFLPSKTLEFSIGSGSARVEASSFSGRVVLRSAD